MNRKTKYTIAGHEFTITDQIEQAVELVEWAKDWIGDAVKVSPEASVAWAGVCMILPLLTKPKAVEEANRDGFVYVTTRMSYYVELEPLLRRIGKSTEVSGALMAKATDHIVELYQRILEFQLRSVLRFYRNWFNRFAQDLRPGDNWEKLLQKIKDLEADLHRDFGLMNELMSRQELESLNETSQSSLKTIQNFLAITARQLKVAEEQFQFHKNKEEAECHQLFRLTAGSNEATYEWYKDRIEERVDGTCQWFLGHDNFTKWREQDSGPLLVSADPGCGKSVLAKHLVERILPESTSATICYFFFKEQDQNKINQALCALLHQLFCHQPSLLRPYAMPEYSKNGRNLINSTSSLWNILVGAAQDPNTKPLIVVLDALDECTESDFRDLVRMLKSLFCNARPGRGNLRFLLTCRPYPQIVSAFHELVENFPYIRIPGEEDSDTISKEVNHVINHRVEELQLSGPLKRHLADKLLEIPHRTYLWVYLVFEHLKGEHFKKTRKGINAAIETLPKSVNEAYEQILSKSKNDAEVRKVLSIILAAARPLTVSEMNVAMNIDETSRSFDDLELEGEEDFRKSIRSLCGLFISIHHNKIYFLHLTAREFLRRELASPTATTIRSGLHWHQSITDQDANAVLAQLCLTYLSLFSSGAPPPLEVNPETGSYIDYPFFTYSCDWWADHFCGAHNNNYDVTMVLASKICSPRSPTYLGWEEFCQYIRYSTPLSMVAARGQEAVVKLLLDRGAEVEVPDRNGQTPLFIAAARGREATVQLLLNIGAKINVQDNAGDTPLSAAVICGQEAVVKLLLDKGAEVDVQDRNGQTPLSIAAGGGNEAMVQLLLSRGAKIDVQDTYNQTPLSRATEYGHETVVQLMLHRRARD